MSSIADDVERQPPAGEAEDEFLRRLIMRLRGAMIFATVPEARAILREVVAEAEDRLALLHEAKLGRAKR